MAVGCAGAALVAAGCGLTNASSKTTTVTRTVTHTVTKTVTASAAPAGTACTAGDLSASFQVLQGSAGAGNIVYTLQATNRSQQTCTLRGVPKIAFLDTNGDSMHSTIADTSGKITTVSLDPGGSATAQVRFSPDVDPCDPGTASTLRVEFPDGTALDTNLEPQTRLCGAGSLQPTPFKGAD